MARVVLGPLTLLAALASACGDDASPAVCDEETRISCRCPETGLSGFVGCEDGVLGACRCELPDASAGGCTDDVQCDDGAFCNGEERCVPESPDADERGCLVGMFVPFCEDALDCTVDACSDALNRCVFSAPDEDADGFGAASCLDGKGEPLGDDCDDADPMRFPGNFEVCDEEDRDEDCDPETFGDKDLDGDGAIDAECCNAEVCGDDCDDALLSRRPLQVEFCDEVDNDCDDTVDEEAVEVPWFEDADGDGFGSGEDAMLSCVPIPGRSLVDTDCAPRSASQHPAQLEICDFVDNNCDGFADEGSGCGVPGGYPVGPGGGATGGGGGGSGGGGGGGGDGDGGTDSGTPPLPGLMACPSRDVTGATAVTGAVDVDTTWSGVVHLTGLVHVGGGATLTIMPGTRIVADPGAELVTGWNSALAKIVAVGTEAAPITLCGKAALPGYWLGLRLQGTTDPASSLSWVLVADAGDGVAALRVEAPVPLTDVHVRDGGDVGVEASNFGPGSTRIIATGHAVSGLALTSELAFTRLPTNSLWTGNANDRVEVRDLGWDVGVTVHDAGVPYFVTSDLMLRGDNTFVFEAGVELVMEADVMVAMGWNGGTNTLQLDGTAAAPVVFRGKNATPGFWVGVDLQSAVRTSSTLRHVEIRDAGNGGAAFDVNAKVLIEDLLLDGNAGIGMSVAAVGLQPTSKNLSIVNGTGTAMSVNADALISLGTSISISGNGADVIELQQNTHINNTGTIRNYGVPYSVPFGTTTRGTSVVTIQPGVVFEMGDATEFVVGWNSAASTILAVGTAASPIVFRNPSNAKGSWEGVELAYGVMSASRLEYVRIEDGGAVDGGNLFLSMNATLPAANLNHCTFENSSAYGIFQNKNYGVDYTANSNTFTGNTSGSFGGP